MRRRTFVAIGLITAALLALTAVGPALAGGNHPGRKADGVWCYTPDLSKLTPFAFDAAYEGPKQFFTTVEDAEWTGVFEGLSRDYGAISIPSPDAAGPTMAMLTVIFDEVEVRGKTGQLELDAYGGRPDGTSDWEGNWVITSASGELEGLKGHGTWWGPGYSLDTPDECGVIYYDVRRLTRSGRGANS